MNTILKEEVKRVFCNCEGDNDVEDLIERLRGAPKESLHQLLIKMIMFKSFPLVQLVVELGADIEEPIGEGITPLLYACQEGQLEIVDYLAKMGASPFKCCERGRNALVFGVMGRSLSVVKWAVNHGIGPSTTFKHSVDSPINLSGLNALHAAVGVPSQYLQDGDEEKICVILDFLIEQGATPPEPSKHAPCPLQLAMANGLYKAAKILGKICPKPSLYDSPMILAFPEILRNYLEAGADVHEKSIDGDPALLVAIMTGEAQNIFQNASLLIEDGADIHYVDDAGWTLLHNTVFGRDECMFPLIEFLLEQGLDINAKDHRGNTPLDLAIIFKISPKRIEFLQRHGGIAMTQNPSLTN